ncbi:hypothetical protein HRbin11_01595 [bacterium HR11]|nr:hypothetical protein HRbin11_01595 [bacterium HR11]
MNRRTTNPGFGKSLSSPFHLTFCLPNSSVNRTVRFMRMASEQSFPSPGKHDVSSIWQVGRWADGQMGRRQIGKSADGPVGRLPICQPADWPICRVLEKSCFRGGALSASHRTSHLPNGSVKLWTMAIGGRIIQGSKPPSQDGVKTRRPQFAQASRWSIVYGRGGHRHDGRQRAKSRKIGAGLSPLSICRPADCRPAYLTTLYLASCI